MLLRVLGAIHRIGALNGKTRIRNHDGKFVLVIETLKHRRVNAHRCTAVVFDLFMLFIMHNNTWMTQEAANVNSTDPSNQN